MKSIVDKYLEIDKRAKEILSLNPDISGISFNRIEDLTVKEIQELYEYTNEKPSYSKDHLIIYITNFVDGKSYFVPFYSVKVQSAMPNDMTSVYTEK